MLQLLLLMIMMGIEHAGGSVDGQAEGGQSIRAGGIAIIIAIIAVII